MTPAGGERMRCERVAARIHLLVVVAVAGLLVTIAVSALPFAQFAYRSVRAHIVIETVTSLVALLSAVLLFGRVRRTGSSTELALMAALAVLGSSDLLYSLLPGVFDENPGSFATWAPAAGRLMGAIGFLIAALARERLVTRVREIAPRVLLACLLGVLAVGLIMLVISSELPRGVDPELSPIGSNRPRVVGHLAVLANQLVIFAVYTTAAVRFALLYRQRADDLVFWIALAAVLAALARLNYFPFPSLYSQWIYTGDLFRMAASVALLGGIVTEVTEYQRQLAANAVFEERRRFARDLHDGVAQDLAFIRSESDRLAAGVEAWRVDRIASVAQRALDDSRSAIAGLSRPVDEPLDQTLRETTGEAAYWVDNSVDVRVEVDDAAQDIVPAVREAVIRIAREAVANAVRHGRASSVRIEVKPEADGVLLRIMDNGSGFNPQTSGRSGSFGLTSMRQRAERLGGELRLRSRPGEGTEVEVLLP